jgi:hypothetical protein
MKITSRDQHNQPPADDATGTAGWPGNGTANDTTERNTVAAGETQPKRNGHGNTTSATAWPTLTADGNVETSLASLAATDTLAIRSDCGDRRT